MADLETLRPEVREAVEYLHDAATLGNGTPIDQSAHVRTIRAELLRLANENANYGKSVVEQYKRGVYWMYRAKEAEAELANVRRGYEK